MQLSLLNNPSATSASHNLSKAMDAHRRSLARLSSGNRIVNPADDAGGLAVGNKLDSKLSRLEKVHQNLKNTISFTELQESALRTVGTIITRMSELKTMSTDVTKNSADIENYNKEFVELQKQIEAMTKHKFNGVSLFSNTSKFAETDADGRSGHGVDLARNFVFDEYVAESGAVLVQGAGNTEIKTLFSGSSGTDLNGNKLTVGSSDPKWNTGVGSPRRVITPDPSYVTQSTANANWIGGGDSPNQAWVSFDLGDLDVKKVKISVDEVAVGEPSFSLILNNFSIGTSIPSNGVTVSLQLEIDPNGTSISVGGSTSFSTGTFTKGVNTLGFWALSTRGHILIDNMTITAEAEVESYPNLDQFTAEDFTNFTQSVASAMAEVGSHQSRLNMEVRQNESARVNLEAAKSRIMDVDMAQESTRYAKTNVLVQSSASMVAQANQLSDIALRLMVNR